MNIEPHIETRLIRHCRMVSNSPIGAVFGAFLLRVGYV
jgi:hypothetical protein